MNSEKLPLLAAYCDDTLSVEAAEQLVRMSEDRSMPACEGEDLPTVAQWALREKTHF